MVRNTSKRDKRPSAPRETYLTEPPVPTLYHRHLFAVMAATDDVLKDFMRLCDLAGDAVEGESEVEIAIEKAIRLMAGIAYELQIASAELTDESYRRNAAKFEKLLRREGGGNA